MQRFCMSGQGLEQQDQDRQNVAEVWKPLTRQSENENGAQRNDPGKQSPSRLLTR
jgi:hypothetical protein